MTDETPNEPLDALFEGYLNGTLAEARLGELEARLLADGEARRAFVRYVRLHTDLVFELRARQASDRVLDRIGRDLPALAPTRAVRRTRRLGLLLAAAAALLLAVGVGWRLAGPRTDASADEAVAWLANAQNCTWAGGEPPGELRPGRALRIDRGLAEVRFRCGARIVIQGPAHLDIVSDRKLDGPRLPGGHGVRGPVPARQRDRPRHRVRGFRRPGRGDGRVRVRGAG
jgi:hypothetical protein